MKRIIPLLVAAVAGVVIAIKLRTHDTPMPEASPGEWELDDSGSPQ